MKYQVENYDVRELGKFITLEGKYIKRVSLWFQDDDFLLYESVDIGGNITGFDLIEFCIDKILDSSVSYTVFPKNSQGDVLVIDDAEELKSMLIRFQVDKVFIRES